MGTFSDVLEDALLDHAFINGAYTAVDTIFLALSTADPLDNQSGLTEPSGNGYARKTITFDAAVGRELCQAAVVTYDQASGTWGGITHYALMNASAVGTMLAHGAFTATKTIVSGNTASVAQSEVIVSFTTGAIATEEATKMLDFAFRKQTYTQVATIFVALSTTTPSDAGNVTEPGGANYSRAGCNNWAAASGGALDNAEDITFAAPSGSWGLITHCALYNTTGTGGYMANGDVADQTPDSGDTVKFVSGALDVTLV